MAHAAYSPFMPAAHEKKEKGEGKKGKNQSMDPVVEPK